MGKRLQTARQTGPNRTINASLSPIGCHTYLSSFLFSSFETLFRTGLMPSSVISIFRFFEDVIERYHAERIRGQSIYSIGRLKSAVWPRERAHWTAIFQVWSYIVWCRRSTKDSCLLGFE